jgi:ribosomal protein S17
MKNTRKFKARNEDMSLKIGDMVVIEETRPYSKEVTWKVIEKREIK